ncbi:MAG: XdhC family protein [Alphaproteobacteria bacterium]|nr:XdhC family protein [Alphaproteobacteria bacterium]
MDPHLLKELNVARTSRNAVLMLTDLNDGGSRLIRPGDVVAEDLAGPVSRAFQTGKSATVEMGGRTYFLNVHVPAARLVIIGAVHISQALAPMATMAGFDVRVIDPRSAFATAERFVGVDLVADWPADDLSRQPLDAYTGLAAVTHDPKIDDDALAAALEAGCFYVGALGSRKTHAKRVDRLLASGIDQQAVERISAPIGLDIGAASPSEIAVAILAELIAHLRTREVALP